MTMMSPLCAMTAHPNANIVLDTRITAFQRFTFLKNTQSMVEQVHAALTHSFLGMNLQESAMCTSQMLNSSDLLTGTTMLMIFSQMCLVTSGP